MTQISAKVVADSMSPQGNRLTTLEIVFPRFILSEVNTHRMLSKNSASSRAIPFKKMVEMVKANPFIPIAWQKDHKGMQGTEYLIENEGNITAEWMESMSQAVERAEIMSGLEVTKQLANRILEPFMMHKVLISGTEWENFFQLRCPSYEYETADGKDYYRSKKDWLRGFKETEPDEEVYQSYLDENDLFWLQLNKGQAEIHMMALAEAIWDAMNESEPMQLVAGGWHFPYASSINFHELFETEDTEDYSGIPKLAKVATGMAARVSYTTVGDEKEVSYKTLIGIHDKMKVQVPFHASPFEHCAKAMSNFEYYTYLRGRATEEDNPEREDYSGFGWCKNYRGFIQYRELLENK